jgi:small-conductance mechanosensitive channel
MFYSLLNEFIKAYGQDEIDVGIETDGGDSGAATGGGAESSVVEEQSESTTSIRTTEAIEGIGSYLDSVIFSIIAVAVAKISLLYTKIKTVRNELVAIPNQTLLQRQIVNYSGLDVLSITVNFSMTYNNSRRLIEKLLVESAKNTDGIVTSESFSNELANHANSSLDNAVTDPFVLLVKFGDYGAVYDLRAFTNKPREFLKIASEVRKKVYDSFQEHGIDLTVPQAQTGLDKNGDNESHQNNNSLKDLR